MVSKPTILPEWAANDVQDPVSNQFNVVEPPTEKKLSGWFLGEKPNRQWWNWLHRQAYLWLQFLSQQEAFKVVTNANGINLYPTDGSLITLDAVDLSDSTKYLRAIGIKTAGVVPQLTVISSSGLALGTGTITGNQPVTGGTNVIISANTSVIPI